jgi:hypothetical protein
MTGDLEKLINKALLHWKAREISLHFHGRKKGGITWIARAYLSHSQVQARLVESGAEGSITLEKLTAMADRRGYVARLVHPDHNPRRACSRPQKPHRFCAAGEFSLVLLRRFVGCGRVMRRFLYTSPQREERSRHQVSPHFLLQRIGSS